MELMQRYQTARQPVQLANLVADSYSEHGVAESGTHHVQAERVDPCGVSVEERTTEA